MKTYNSRSGLTIVDVILAVVLLGIATAGIIKFTGGYTAHLQQLNTLTQENSYRVFQNELALSGASPGGMAGSNPLSALNSGSAPTPGSQQVTLAGRNQTGSANVAAYTATQDQANRSAALGFRIASTGTAVPAPPAPALAPPSFLYSGVVPEAAFAPNLTGLIIANATNPAGTVYRYTTDGSTPTASSPIWTAASFLLAYPLPPVVKAAAFNSDPDWSPSPVVTTDLSRVLALTYSRSLGGNSTGFLYSDVTGGTNDILLSITNAPAGTNIYYTYDGTNPATSPTAVLYTTGFQVPLGSWAATVPLQVIAVTPATNITVTAATFTLTPIVVPMPTPTFGTSVPGYTGGQPAGEPSTVSVLVFSTISGAVLRYAIDTAITGTSPTTSSGDNVTVTAP